MLAESGEGVPCVPVDVVLAVDVVLVLEGVVELEPLVVVAVAEECGREV
jgi:hypothetical protein